MQTSNQNMINKNLSIPNNRKKRSAGETQQQDFSILNDSLKLIDAIFQMRFIQKISRPIEKRVKEQYVQKLAGKMQSLHTKLERIKIQIVDKAQSQNGNLKGKSIMGSATHKPVDWKKSIRLIQNRYCEVFIDGSFKFYPKLYEINKFTFTLKVMNIQQWAAYCLNQKQKRTSCC